MPRIFVPDNNTTEQPTVWKEAVVVPDSDNTSRSNTWKFAVPSTDAPSEDVGSAFHPNCPNPVASFSVAGAALAKTFTDTSTNTPTSWLWDFGDGNSSTVQNPVHTYAAPGNYSVILRATNECGTDLSDTVVVNAVGDPDFAAVLYLLDGSFDGSSRILDKSSYSAVYQNKPKFVQSSDVPAGFGGFSIRHPQNILDASPLAIFSGGPAGAPFDGDTWTVEAWLKFETGSKTRVTLGSVQGTASSGTNISNAGLAEDVSPSVRRGFINNSNKVLPGVTGDNLGAFIPYDVWKFYAFVCKDGNVAIWIDGVRRSFVANTVSVPAATVINTQQLSSDAFGANPASSWYLTELRYTNGVARVDPTSLTYPVPTSRFPQL